ncbi:MAG: Fe-S cluster assembly protein SufD [Candidatus Krumholzibacteriia bacterium]
MTQVTDGTGLYLSRFAELEKRSASDGSAWLAPVREEAMSRFARMGFPSMRLESWKYFNAGPIRRTAFKHVLERDRVTLKAERLRPFQVHCLPCALLVFVDGYYEPVLSSMQTLPDGVVVGDLATALKAHPAVLERHLARHAAFDTHPFVALNTALLHDGAFVRVPKGRVVQEPIHLLFVSTGMGGPTVSHPRTIVVVEDGAQLTLIEDYVSLDEATYFTNPVTEVILEEGAVLDFYKLERESKQAFHVGAMQVHQSRNSSFSSTSIALGGHLVRNDVHAVLDGEGASCTLNGLNILGDRQLVDDHTCIMHAKPHGTSQELYKSILDGHAEGVFNGEIYVAQDAQKTSSQQTNKSLVLSKHALMNTKPQLKIYADDVKCSHGAAIGELEKDALFYLRARGIDYETSRRILTYAFASDVVERIRLEPLRKTVESLLLSFIPRGTDAKEPC